MKKSDHTKLVLKVSEVGNTADRPNPLGFYLIKTNLRVPKGQRKFGPSGKGVHV